MTKRVQLGLRSGQYGLWVSRPGIDVDTAKKGDMLFDSTSTGFGQIVESGSTPVTFGSPQSIYFALPAGSFAVAEAAIGSANYTNYPSLFRFVTYEIEENGASSRLILTTTQSGATYNVAYIIYHIALGDL